MDIEIVKNIISMDRTWRSMMNRCTNKNCKQWKNYGGRGISVCQRWHNFLNFFQDMGLKPFLKYDLDRIDNNGNYEPGNCRWVTRKVNARNRRNNHFITYQGQTKTISEWAEISGVDQRSIHRRIKANWSVCKALTTPEQYAHQTHRKLTHNGITKTLREWSKEVNLHPETIRRRLSLGWSSEAALTKPLN